MGVGLLLLGASVADATSSFDDGLAARQQWEQFFARLDGSARSGAAYWAGERSKPHPRPCSTFVDPDFIRGCEIAQQMLSGSDGHRRADAAFRQGWNSYTDQANASVAPPPAHDPLTRPLFAPPTQEQKTEPAWADQHKSSDEMVEGVMALVHDRCQRWAQKAIAVGAQAGQGPRFSEQLRLTWLGECYGGQARIVDMIADMVDTGKVPQPKLLRCIAQARNNDDISDAGAQGLANRLFGCVREPSPPARVENKQDEKLIERLHQTALATLDTLDTGTEEQRRRVEAGISDLASSLIGTARQNCQGAVPANSVDACVARDQQAMQAVANGFRSGQYSARKFMVCLDSVAPTLIHGTGPSEATVISALAFCVGS